MGQEVPQRALDPFGHAVAVAALFRVDVAAGFQLIEFVRAEVDRRAQQAASSADPMVARKWRLGDRL